MKTLFAFCVLAATMQLSLQQRPWTTPTPSPASTVTPFPATTTLTVTTFCAAVKTNCPIILQRPIPRGTRETREFQLCKMAAKICKNDFDSSCSTKKDVCKKLGKNCRDTDENQYQAACDLQTTSCGSVKPATDLPAPTSTNITVYCVAIQPICIQPAQSTECRLAPANCSLFKKTCTADNEARRKSSFCKQMDKKCRSREYEDDDDDAKYTAACDAFKSFQCSSIRF